MQVIKQLIQANAKAIAAFVTSLVVALVLKATGVELPADVQVAIGSLVIAFAVWFTSNK